MSKTAALLVILMTSTEWWETLSATKKGLLVIISTLAIGFGAGATVSSQIGLPADVKANEVAIERHDDRVTLVEQYIASDQNLMRYMAEMQSWTSCALEAHDAEMLTVEVCGQRPLVPIPIGDN